MPSGAMYLFLSSGERVALFNVNPYMLWRIERSMFILCVYFCLLNNAYL